MSFTFSKYVVNIILLYISPDNIISLFYRYDFDFRMNFIYKIYEKTNKTFLKYLPNIVIKQDILCAYNTFNTNSLYDVINRTFDDFHITALNSVKIYDFDEYDIHKVITNCVNLKKLVLENVNMRNLGFIAEHREINNLKFHICRWDLNSCAFLPKCVNLKKLMFDCSLYDDDMLAISQCTKLKSLIIRGFRCKKGGALSCVNLRKLKVRGINKNETNFSVIYGCENLRSITFKRINCGFKEFDFSKFKKLKNVVFVECNYLTSSMGLEKCEEIKYIKFIRCDNERSTHSFVGINYSIVRNDNMVTLIKILKK